MQVTQYFEASLTSPAIATIPVMQGDGARLLVAQLKKDTAPWPVPEGISAGLSYELPNQAPGYYDRLNDGTQACVINGDQVSVRLDPILTERPGPIKASIILRDPDGIQVATFPFHILVEQVPGLVHGENMQVPAHRFDGKIYYGGVAGIPQPLGLGNGMKAEKQKDGSLLLVAEGNTPVRGMDYWTAADQEFIVQQVIAALGTPVFGQVDADKNIILTGELADGTYTVKYEDAEGNLVEIGTMTKGTIGGPVELVWRNSVTINSTTGAEESYGDTMNVTQEIVLQGGAAYTLRVKDRQWAKFYTYWYNEDAYLGRIHHDEDMGKGPDEHFPAGASTVITPMAGATKFKLRLNTAQNLTAEQIAWAQNNVELLVSY